MSFLICCSVLGQIDRIVFIYNRERKLPEGKRHLKQIQFEVKRAEKIRLYHQTSPRKKRAKQA